jgi:hypothetical protein
MKKLILITFLLFSLNYTVAQDSKPKLYYLADTINVTKNNRVLDIKIINDIEYSFIFYCKGMKYNNEYVSFHYMNFKKNKAEIVAQKPDFPYMSYKVLMDMANEHHRFFSKYYDLYITEVLPGNRYRTNRVEYKPPTPATIDYIILNPKQ